MALRSRYEVGGVYLRCLELDSDGLATRTEADAGSLVTRAQLLGANALRTDNTTIPAVLDRAARSVGLVVIGATGNGRWRNPAAIRPDRAPVSWPNLPPGAAAARLARRHRAWPRALRWVRSAEGSGGTTRSHVATASHGSLPPNPPVPSNVVAAVRRMAGRPGTGFSAPWPEHPRDPAWAPITVLPEPPPIRLRPGQGFAVNLWLCTDSPPTTDDARVTAALRWGDRVHSWAFAGPLLGTTVATIATLPVVRPVDDPLSLELSLSYESEACSGSPATWRYLLTDDTADVPFWSLSIPEE